MFRLNADAFNMPPGVLTGSDVGLASSYTTAASSSVTVRLAVPVDPVNAALVLVNTASVVYVPWPSVTWTFASDAVPPAPNVTGASTLLPFSLNCTLPETVDPFTCVGVTVALNVTRSLYCCECGTITSVVVVVAAFTT